MNKFIRFAKVQVLLNWHSNFLITVKKWLIVMRAHKNQNWNNVYAWPNEVVTSSAPGPTLMH